MGRITYRQWPHPASAYITGISVGILVRSPFSLAVCARQPDLDRVEVRAAVQRAGTSGTRRTSASARCCSWRRRPCRCSSIQWGNTLWPMVVIWLLGAVIVWRVGRLHISATYVASFLLFSRSFAAPSPATRGWPTWRRSPARCISCSSSSW